MAASFVSNLSGKVATLAAAVFSLRCVSVAYGMDSVAEVTLFGFKDTEGDYVELKSEEAGFALYGNGEIIIPRVETFVMDGRRLTASSAGDKAGGEIVEATTLVQEGQESVVADVMSLLNKSIANVALSTAPAKRMMDDGMGIKLDDRNGEEFGTQPEVNSDTNPEAQPEGTVTLQIDPDVSPSSVDVFRDPYHSALQLRRLTFDANILHGGGSGAAEHWVVLFCYSWWSPCQAMMEPYSRLASTWQDTLNTALLIQKVRFAWVDCATDRVLCNERDVEQYPHLQHYAQGSLVAKWSGGRESDLSRLEKWLAKQLAKAPATDIGVSVDTATDKVSLFDIHGFFGIGAKLNVKDLVFDAVLIFTVIALNVRVVVRNPALWLQPPACLEKRNGIVVRVA